MIDKEKIYGEASDVYEEKFLNDTYGTIYFDNGDQEEAHTPDQVKEAFVRGAEWAQEEFVKKLWHDASEEPCGHKEHIIIKYDKLDYGCNFQVGDFTNWKRFAEVSPSFRWCYFSDVLPKKKGGEE